ncbi:hypothetical protein C8J56DRAFT_927967 [Mycena floridula]|nr:hypothetical protein C8J56DRAFT_927967 [Mycena floridula]
MKVFILFAILCLLGKQLLSTALPIIHDRTEVKSEIKALIILLDSTSDTNTAQPELDTVTVAPAKREEPIDSDFGLIPQPPMLRNGLDVRICRMNCI